MGINVSQVLHSWAKRDNKRVAVYATNQAGEARSVSYGELDALARSAAAELAAAGLHQGDAVALSCANSLEFVAAWFGALYHGCVVLPVPPMSAAPELRHRLEHARCKVLITDAQTAHLGQLASAGLPVVQRDVATLFAAACTHPGPVDLPAESVAMVLYTSGTTGSAKGAMISHASLFSHTAALVHHTLPLTANSVVLGALPLTHSYGVRITLLAPFFAGARVHLMPRFQAAQALASMADAQITWFPGVPTMFHAIAHEPRAVALPHLVGCLSAGAPLPRDVRLRAEAVLGAKIRQGFGLTEATFSTVAQLDDDAGADSVGAPVFGVDVHITDNEGRVLPVGEHGEVCVRGQNVMAGYLYDETATRCAMRDGYLRTGDVGFLDAVGRLTVVDRIKDLIIRGGFNVVPAEVEAVLVAHESVRDAVVVGVPDARYGEEVVAVLVLREGAQFDGDALLSHCGAQLSRTKLPRRYALIDALPVGASGKVQRRVVRDAVRSGSLPVHVFKDDRVHV